jgi:hypothetical protein
MITGKTKHSMFHILWISILRFLYFIIIIIIIIIKIIQQCSAIVGGI